jgi:hypothetical protein
MIFMSEWPRYYILVDRLPVPVDHDTWMRWFETSDRQIGDDKIGKTRVSTVFLGIDHNFYGSSGPVLFQTLIFDGPLADEMWRYSTYAEAERGHQEAVTQARIAATKIKSIADKAGI